MTLDEIKTVGEYKHVQVRYITEEGIYFRRTISPGDDYSNEEAEIQAVCQEAHTQEVIAAYQGREAS